MPYRVGLIGSGRKGFTIDEEGKCPINGCYGPASHVSAVAALAETELVAIAERNETQRKLIKERLPLVKLYDTHEAMLEQEGLDIVAIATRAPDHAGPTIAAAQHGIRAVIVEKALAISMDEADSMLSACEESGTALIVNHTRRYHPTFIQVRDAVAAGEIGTLQLIVGTVGRGIVHNGTHFTDLFRLYAGDAKAVSGTVFGPTDTDTGGYCTVEFGNGVVAMLDAQSQTEICMTLYGDRGRIVIDSSFPGYEVVQYVESGRGKTPDAWYKGGPCRERTSRLVEVTPTDGGAMLALYRDAIAALESKTATPLSTGEDGAAALEMCLAAFASSAEGKRVSLPLADRHLGVMSR